MVTYPYAIRRHGPVCEQSFMTNHEGILGLGHVQMQLVKDYLTSGLRETAGN